MSQTPLQLMAGLRLANARCLGHRDRLRNSDRERALAWDLAAQRLWGRYVALANARRLAARTRPQSRRKAR